MQTLGDCARQHPNVLSVFPKIVLLLYNADIIEEAAVLEWYSRLQGAAESPSGFSGSKKQDLIMSIQPVIEWLENAEEETSEEESEEED